MTTTPQIKWKNKQLKIHPFCYWCGIKVVKFYSSRRKGETVPDNTATLDHLIGKYEKEKRYSTPQLGEKRRVLSCRTCNQRRGELVDFERGYFDQWIWCGKRPYIVHFFKRKFKHWYRLYLTDYYKQVKRASH